MLAGSRVERVEQYRNRCEYAQKLIARGRNEEALSILAAWRDRAAAAGDEDYRLYFEQEILRHTQPDFPEQIRMLEKALQWGSLNDWDSDPCLLSALGECFHEHGDLAQARGGYERALAADPMAWPAMSGLIGLLGETGDVKAADALLEGAAEANTERRFELFRLRASMHARRAEWHPSLKWIDYAIRLAPDNEDLMLYKAVVLLHLRRHEEAIEWCDRALAIRPGDVEVLVAKARALQNLDRDREALKCVDRVLARAPSHPEALSTRARALLNLGRGRRALEAVERALMVDLDSLDLWVLKGEALTGLGRRDEGLEWYTKVLARDPDNIMALFGKATALGNMKNFYAALENLDRVLTRDPRNFLAMMGKAYAYGGLGEPETAAVWFDRALSQDPNWPDAVRDKGRCLLVLGDPDGARECFDQALALAPNDLMALRLRMSLRFHSWRFGAALADVLRYAKARVVGLMG
jgi:tetratricopeptide (TPR) repeat protein